MISFDEANKLAIDYAPLLSAAKVAWALLVAILTVVAFFWKKIWGIVSSWFRREKASPLTPEMREIYRAVYAQIDKSLRLFLENNRDLEKIKEAKALIWEARNRAKLELSEDIFEYAENIFKKISEYHDLTAGRLMEHKDGGLPDASTAKWEAHERSVSIYTELCATPIFDVFSPYLRIVKP